MNSKINTLQTDGDTLWAKSFGGTGNDIGTAVKVDSSGNIILAGRFANSNIDFGGGYLIHNNGMYIAKFSSSGTHIWSKSIESDGGNVVKNITIDKMNDIIVNGSFIGNVDFGGGMLNSDGYNDIFVAKYSSNGAHIWSKRFGSTNDDVSYGISTDSYNNVIITGFFTGTVDFGGGPLTSYAGGYDLFIAKFSSSGTHIWSQKFLNTSVDIGYSVSTDSNDNILLTGYFDGVINLGGNNLITIGGTDIFVAKFSPSGSHIWSKSFGGIRDDYGYDIAVDSNDDVIITGIFTDTINFGGELLTSNGMYDIYIAKFSGIDCDHLWSKHFGGIVADISNRVAIDTDNNIIITGYFKSTIDFGGGVLTCNGIADIFVAKFSPSGNHIWSKRFGNSEYNEGFGVTSDSNNNVIVTGTFMGIINFGLSSLTSNGNNDIFLMKLYGTTSNCPPIITNFQVI